MRGRKFVKERPRQGGGRPGNRVAIADSGSRLVIGRNAVEAALSKEPCSVNKLLVASDSQGRAKDLVSLAEKRGVEVEVRSKTELTARAGSESHQGFVALMSSRQLAGRLELVNHLQKRERFVLIALDGVTDPHNVGAILRAGECFSIDGVVWSKNRCPGITPAVTKVAVGATELLDLFEVSNLAEVLLLLQQELGATIVCADGSSDSVDVSSIAPVDRMVLVLGSEGDGVSDLVKRRADVLARIPMLGKIDSLNVSQAAAVLLYAIRIALGSQ